jgi:2-polyprenyl-6-methoxyphenol hydroxylase-like FAD-dependent oxidoreductase
MVQVLVVGAGPVGLTMAAELARWGVTVRIVDKAAAATDKSKALVVWPRTLELLDRMGCAQAFLATGFKSPGANITGGARRLARVPFGIVDSPFPYALMIAQSETERLMTEHLAGLGITVERSVELLSMSQDDRSVTSVLRHPDGREETLRTDWLAGCDGAHSGVRKALGKPFSGHALDSDWVLADLHLAGWPLPPDELGIFFHADGVLATFPIGGDRHRVVADIGPAVGERRPDPDLAAIQGVLDRRGPAGVRAHDPIWLSAFRINERKVADYRQDRVFLAGDAAHIHSPAGGQGMNTGMQDAINLAWKLALVCRGEAGDGGPLLASYSAERSAVGEQVLANAGRLTKMALLRNPVLQAVRNTAVGLLARLKPVQMLFASRLAELDIAYPGSPLTGPGGGARLRPGRAGPPERTPRFQLAGQIEPAALDQLQRQFPTLLHSQAAPATGTGLLLVRPDGYVALAGTDRAAIEAYLGRLAPREAAMPSYAAAAT